MQNRIEKYCPKCKEIKPTINFGISKNKYDGYQGYCKSCVQYWRKENKDKANEWRRVYYKKDPERQKKLNLKRIRENPDKHSKYNRDKYNSDPKWKQTKKIYGEKYAKLHFNKKRAQSAKRRCAKLKRTPKWANLKEIKNIYDNCPKGMVVDHIIPLQGKLVSGFHVEYNLQYLTPKENSEKGTKLL